MKTTESLRQTTTQAHISTAQIEQLVHGPQEQYEQRQAERTTHYEQARTTLQAALDMRAEFTSIATSQTDARQLRNLCIGCFHDFAAYFLSEDKALASGALPEQRTPDEQPLPASFVDLRVLLDAYDQLEHDPGLDPLLENVISDVERTPLTRPMIDAYVDARLSSGTADVMDIYTDKINEGLRAARRS